jgi:hypothetical protein
MRALTASELQIEPSGTSGDSSMIPAPLMARTSADTVHSRALPAS